MDGDAAFSEPRLTAHLTTLTTSLAAETGAREKADADMLTLATEVFGRLQRDALENFGTEDVVASYVGGGGAGKR